MYRVICTFDDVKSGDDVVKLFDALRAIGAVAMLGDHLADDAEPFVFDEIPSPSA